MSVAGCAHLSVIARCFGLDQILISSLAVKLVNVLAETAAIWVMLSVSIELPDR